MKLVALVFACLLTLPGATCSQTRDELAQTAEALKWNVPAKPMRIAGPLYFVGTEGLAVWLITTSAGNVLINTGMPPSGQMIEASVRELGFDPKSIKLMLTGHAHLDHVGGHAYMQKASGARIAMMSEEVALFESGGELDFQYGKLPAFRFEPAKVGQVLHDGETLKFGDISITAHRTPGHTKGCTTYVTRIADGGKTYNLVFADGTSVNPGYRLGENPSYPGIADDFRRTFAVLESLTPDIWVTPHTDVFGFAAKRERATREGVAAWVDPEGYRKWVATVRARFEERL